MRNGLTAIWTPPNASTWGGPSSVAGYPVGKVSGDLGGQLQLELRRDLSMGDLGVVTLGGFYQWGRVTQHRTVWPGWQGALPDLKRHVTLASHGVSASAVLRQSWVIRGAVGWQQGDTDVADPVSGVDSDGRSLRHRAWLQLIRYF